MNGPSVVAIGGGTGLPVALRAVRTFAGAITAVVTVADNGGSSGRLRRDLGILPPGDIRNCLVALAEEESILADIFQYRFTSGNGITGHAIGNLIIAALADLREDFVSAIEQAGSLLGARGRVLPSTLSSVSLNALTASGGQIRGQARVARTKKPIVKVSLDPLEPAAFPATIDAILGADLVIIGPGSLFTSIIPNLLVPAIRQAVNQTSAQVIFVMNAMTQLGETSLYTATDHINAFYDHCGEGLIDVVVANIADGRIDGLAPVGESKRHLIRPCADAIKAMGCQVKIADLVEEGEPSRHDPAKLAAVLEGIAREATKATAASTAKTAISS